MECCNFGLLIQRTMKHVSRLFLISAASLLTVPAGCGPAAEEPPAGIIPKPVHLAYDGKTLEIGQGVHLVTRDTALEFSRALLADGMEKLSHAEFLRENKKAPVSIRLKLDDRIEHPEGYTLTIDRRITLAGRSREGVLHGIQSLLQIIQQAPVTDRGVQVPRLTIIDYPRFASRGVHLEVSRHFFQVDCIKKYLDLIAMHKMNVIHWHLTDGQGRHLETQKHPELTGKSDRRADHADLPRDSRTDQAGQDSATCGGSYTLEQFREVVAYASDRGITVIPEIDLVPKTFEGPISLGRVYGYEPGPDGLTPEEVRDILGTQGNGWTEHRPDEAIVEYRVLPGMTALSEVLWSPAEARDLSGFMERLEAFLNWMTSLNYHFQVPVPQGVLREMIFLDSTRVQLQSPWPFAQIRYTVDGSDPTIRSKVFDQPLSVREEMVLKARLFLKMGQQGPVSTVTYRKVQPVPPYEIDPGSLKQGLFCQYYEVAVSSVGEIKKYTPRRPMRVKQVALPEGHRSEVFAAEFIGYLRVPETAVYSFRLTSDDGSRFCLGENLVIDHDGPHGPSVAYGQAALQRGFYPIYVGYFDGGGDNFLEMKWKSGNSEWTDLPADCLFHREQN